MSQALDVLRVIFGMAFLCYASYTDIKVRRVKNEVWLVMAATGGVFLLLQLLYDNKSWEYYLIFVPVTILFGSMFFEHQPLYDPEYKVWKLEAIKNTADNIEKIVVLPAIPKPTEEDDGK